MSLGRFGAERGRRRHGEETADGWDVGSVKSGARILDVLEFIAGVDRPVTLAEVVTELSIPKSSALMLMRTLVAKEYVERDAAGLYRLERLFRAADGNWVGGNLPVLRKIVRPVARELADLVQETVVLGVLTPDFEVKVVEKARSPREVRYEIGLGDQYPAYCTSIGRSILGFMDDEAVRTYLATVPRPQYTPKTVVDADALIDILAQVRRQGYAVNIEEHVDGACSVASPLMHGPGQILGSLNVGCVTANFMANRDHIIQHVTAVAGRFNAALAQKADAADASPAADRASPPPRRRKRSVAVDS